MTTAQTLVATTYSGKSWEEYKTVLEYVRDVKELPQFFRAILNNNVEMARFDTCLKEAKVQRPLEWTSKAKHNDEAEFAKKISSSKTHPNVMAVLIYVGGIEAEKGEGCGEARCGMFPRCILPLFEWFRKGVPCGCAGCWVSGNRTRCAVSIRLASGWLICQVCGQVHGLTAKFRAKYEDKHDKKLVEATAAQRIEWLALNPTRGPQDGTKSTVPGPAVAIPSRASELDCHCDSEQPADPVLNQASGPKPEGQDGPVPQEEDDSLFVAQSGEENNSATNKSASDKTETELQIAAPASKRKSTKTHSRARKNKKTVVAAPVVDPALVPTLTLTGTGPSPPAAAPVEQTPWSRVVPVLEPVVADLAGPVAHAVQQSHPGPVRNQSASRDRTAQNQTASSSQPNAIMADTGAQAGRTTITPAQPLTSQALASMSPNQLMALRYNDIRHLSSHQLQHLMPLQYQALAAGPLQESIMQRRLQQQQQQFEQAQAQALAQFQQQQQQREQAQLQFQQHEQEQQEQQSPAVDEEQSQLTMPQAQDIFNAPIPNMTEDAAMSSNLIDPDLSFSASNADLSAMIGDAYDEVMGEVQPRDLTAEEIQQYGLDPAQYQSSNDFMGPWFGQQ